MDEIRTLEEAKRTIASLEQELRAARDRLNQLTGMIERGTAELQAANDSLQLCGNLVDNSPDPMLVLDRRYTFLIVNSAYARQHNTAPEQIIGKNATDFLGPVFDVMIRPRLEQAFAGQPVHFEKWFDFPTVGERYLEVRYFPLANEQEIVAVVVVLRDITERRQIEEALLDSEARFRAFSEATTEGIVVHESGKIIDVNQALIDHFGYSREELLGMSVLDITAPQSRGDILKRVQEGDPGPYEAASLHKDGTNTIGEIRARNINYKGRPVRVVAIRDITRRKRIEEQLAQSLRGAEQWAAELETTIAAIADGVVIFGPRGEMTRMNEAARELLRYPDELKRQPVAERISYLHMENAAGQPLVLEDSPVYRALHGETVRGEILALYHNGQRIWISASAAPIRTREGEMLGAVATLSDITSLRELQQRQEDLLHIVSHDLRLPITVIRGHLQLIEPVLREREIDAELQGSIAAIDRSIQRMNAMIQDLVDMTRLKGGQMRLELQAVALDSFLDDLLERLQGTLDVQRIVTEVPPDLPFARADYNRLERILVNLLSNALKFSPEDQPVRVSAQAQDDEVVISVTDRGCGIAQADLPKLFQRFYRTGERKPEGIGLGLYITRLLVEVHGGRIWVESEDGKGSTFSFSLPIDQAI